MFQRSFAILLVVLVAAGCATLRPPIEQRTTEGLTAEQMFTYRVLTQNGREPNFEERQTWRDAIDLKIEDYLRRHPEDANSLAVSKFRFLRQASVGMSKEQILILVGAPTEVTTDQAQMEKIARRFWKEIKGNATEAWVYPLGWNFYFAGTRLIEITQYLEDK